MSENADKSAADVVASIRRSLKRDGRKGAMTWLRFKRVFSLVAADRQLGDSAKRAGFDEAESGALTTASPLVAAKFANLADDQAKAEMEAQKINVQAAVADAESKERRRATLNANREAEAKEDNYDTFDGWKEKGRLVKRGEKASKRVGETSFFHFSQTHDPKETRDTYDGWLARGRAVREGEKADRGLFEITQTYDFVAALAERGLRTFEAWKEAGRAVRRGEKSAHKQGGFAFFSEDQTEPC